MDSEVMDFGLVSSMKFHHVEILHGSHWKYEIQHGDRNILQIYIEESQKSLKLH
jgi:hypothetical protein